MESVLPLLAQSGQTRLDSIRKAVERMMTNLVDVEDAKMRLAAGEEAYGFQVGELFTMLGPACRFGADYLQNLRTEGRYAESLEEATELAYAKGASITGIWFVKR